MRSFIIIELICLSLLFSCSQKSMYDKKDWQVHPLDKGWSLLMPKGFVDSAGVLISSQSGIRFRYFAPPFPGSSVGRYSSDCPLTLQRKRAQMQIDNEPTEYKEVNKINNAEVIIINGRAAILRVPKKPGEGLLSVEIAGCRGWNVTVYAETVSEQQRDSAIAIFKTLDLGE